MGALRGPARRGVTVIAVTASLIGLGLAAPAAAGAATSIGGSEVRPFQPGEDGAQVLTPPKSNSPSRVPSAGLPRPTSRSVTTDAGAKRAEGLSLKDTRTANGGNQFSIEPPDQALCVGDDEVIEGVNDAFATYTKAGARTAGPAGYSPFWNDGTPEIIRTPLTYGPFTSDPRCYFDPELHKFFMVELQLSTDPKTGDFTGGSYENIAVSKTATPSTSAGDWYQYRLDVRNDGRDGTVKHAGCPCLGDQPLIGADRYGFYLTTNEFSIDGPEFNGAQIYAFDKAALADGSALVNGTLKVQRIESSGAPLAEGIAYSVQPATSPVAAEWSDANNGTEYALSALDFNAKLDNRVASWALTNTASLTSSHPDVHVSHTVIRSEVYGQPPSVQQKSGPYPLGQSLKDKLNLLQSNDDRMQQVVYAGGKLWSGLNTAAKTENGPTTTEIAYFVVQPTAGPSPASARMANQGYVSVDRNSVMYPSIGVAPHGTKAAMVFTLAGPGYYPSTAYVRLTSSGSLTGPVRIYGVGTKPADGFTGYPQYGGNGQERWGDYSAAVADKDGTVWVAAEYVPGTFEYPPYLANWGTAIGAIG